MPPANQPRTKVDARRAQRLREVCDRIDYGFTNLGILHRALTHSSLGNEGAPDYERLEFLGDAVLGFLVAEELYRRTPEIPEGELTSRRSLMVSRKPLATVAEELGLGSYLLVGRGLTEDNLRSPRILADLVEAVLAAIYLDGGIKAARRFVHRFIVERFRGQDELHGTTDAKTRLNQWAQSHDLGSPNYQIIEATGPDHDPTFRIAVTLDGVTCKSSEVKSKQVGEQEVAADCLKKLLQAAEQAEEDEEECEGPAEDHESDAARPTKVPRPPAKPAQPDADAGDQVQIIWDEPSPPRA